MCSIQTLPALQVLIALLYGTMYLNKGQIPTTSASPTPDYDSFGVYASPISQLC